MRFNVLSCFLSLTKQPLTSSRQEIHNYSFVFPAHPVLSVKELSAARIL